MPAVSSTSGAASSSASSVPPQAHAGYSFLDAADAAFGAHANNQTCFGQPACDPDCRKCDSFTRQCECLRWHINIPAKCDCPRLSSETLVAVGAVVLCLIMLLLAMAVWHWRRCGDRRTTDVTESLLSAGEQVAAGRYRGRVASSFNGRGRTSIDSVISCIVCMDHAIDCVLMPCAHEVACKRCASRLGLCPICRTAVGSTLRIYPADPTSSGGTLPQPQPMQPMPPPVAESEQAAAAAAIAATAAATTTAAAAAAQPGAPAAAAPSAAAEGDDSHLQQGAEQPASAPAAAAPPKPGSMAAMLCLRCASNPPNCVFLPCSHKVWCTDCAAQLPPTCPICNTGITQSLRTFHKRL